MTTTQEQLDALADAAAEPQSAAVDGMSVTNRSVDDQIKVIEYTRSPVTAKNLFGNRVRLISARKE